MSGGELRVEMLPARHGDGLLVEWGEPDDRHRMVIDGGTKSAVSHIRDRIGDDDPVIDLLVVSHIDLDHIEAPIELLRTSGLDLQFGDIWFNDYPHLSGQVVERAEIDPTTAASTRGGVQGEFLGALLDRYRLPWNEAFDRGPVVVPPRGPLPEVPLPGGLTLVLLSPTPAKLTALEPVWEREVAKKDLSPGDRARAIELLEERLGPVQPTRGSKVWGSDGSAANGSSIAFVAEYEHDGGTDRWLLSGDAHVDVLVKSLERYAKEKELGPPVPLDGFKIPHHGSVNNMSEDLLDIIDCRRFLISTNGAYFKHPDAECIEKIIEKTEHPELAFNYRTSFTEPFAGRPDADATYLYDSSHQWLSEPEPPRAVPAAATSGAAAPAPTPSPPPPPPSSTEIVVRVIHGSLDRADSPVIVGHYTATPLSGAEGHIDRRLGGRLSARHSRDKYPGDIGSHLRVRAPARSYPADGVVVVGLGEYGELTPRLLAETIRSSLVAHALDERDATATEPGKLVTLPISAVLVGATGDQGMGVGAAARAIVEGVAAANHSLLEETGPPRCQYDRLDLWERRAPEAEAALLSLAAETDADSPASDPMALPDGVTVEPELLRRDGHLMHSVSATIGVRPWRRIVVTREKEDRDGAGGEADDPLLRLGFVVDRRLAAVGENVHEIEKERLWRMLRDAVDDPKPAPGLYTNLFELLLPNDVKWDLRSAADVQLVVDPATADIPWEMLSARSPEPRSREALALRAPFTRQLVGSSLQQVERADTLRALVIGNPPGGADWPDLPGAYSEAVAVVDTLERYGLEGQVRSRVFKPGETATGDEVSAIESLMFEDEYRIVHIAGHGAFDDSNETRTGVVIGPGAFLTARFLAQLRPIPDLVFLNCCHLGRIGGDGAWSGAQGEHNRLGASLARVLIGSGVRAVVAAGWAVDDAAALAFASTFYERMLESGDPFGEAVFVARRAAHAAAPQSNTWGAYQCYGDSGLRLPSVGAGWLAPAPPTARELLRRIEYQVDQLASRGNVSVAEKTRQAMHEELKILVHAARGRGWLAGDDGGVLAERFAEVHAEMGEFATAIEWYEAALRHPSGGASLRAVEQLANLRDRHAASLLRSQKVSRGDRATAKRLASAAEQGIRLLGQISGADRESSERSALLAGHHKRQATIRTGRQRVASLKRAVAAYRTAYEAAVEANPDDPAPYTFLNYVQLETIRAMLDADNPSSVDDAQRRLVARLTRRRLPESDQQYWDAVGLADALLTKALLDGKLGESRRLRTIANRYEDAFARRSTARERSSAIEHLQDLADLHPDEAEREGLHELIGRINPDRAGDETEPEDTGAES